jgi:hypothetical protein
MDLGVWRCNEWAGGKNGTQLHERAAVGSQSDSHPIKGTGRLGTLHTVNGNLITDQKDEQCNGSPKWNDYKLMINNSEKGKWKVRQRAKAFERTEGITQQAVDGKSINRNQSN